jgi:hypothetical protein
MQAPIPAQMAVPRSDFGLDAGIRYHDSAQMRAGAGGHRNPSKFDTGACVLEASKQTAKRMWAPVTHARGHLRPEPVLRTQVPWSRES